MFAPRDRQDEEELLDRTDIPVADIERSLSDLEKINRWFGGMSAVMPYIIPKLPVCRKILDVGCGSGDMLRTIADAGRAKKIPLELVGVDLNPLVLDYAAKRCANYSNISFVQADARNMPFLNRSFDIVFSSTFLHHMGPDDVVAVLKESHRLASYRIVMSDIIRNNIGLIGVSTIGWLLFGRLSRRDGPASFRKAYLPSELMAFADRAGLATGRVYMHGSFRMTFVWDAMLE